MATETPGEFIIHVVQLHMFPHSVRIISCCVSCCRVSCVSHARGPYCTAETADSFNNFVQKREEMLMNDTF